MASTTRIAVFKSAIVDGLLLRPALASVEIVSASIGQPNALESILFIGEDDIEQDWAGIGRLARDEVLTLQGSIFVKAPGKGEVAIRAARDRAVALMAEIEAFFWDTPTAPSVGGTVKSAMARPVLLREDVTGDGSRLASLLFEVRSGSTRLQNT